MKDVRMYVLDTDKTKQKIVLPEKSRILSVCVKQETIRVSVEEDVNAHIKRDCYHTVEFAVIKEGHYLYVDDYQFLGTIVLEFGNTICHVFYRNV